MVILFRGPGEGYIGIGCQKRELCNVVLNLCFAGLIAFQTPLATLFAIRNGIVESRVIRAHRRHVWFAAVVAGALLSPPDPLSMILVSAPIIILFEFALLIDTILR